MIFFLSFTNSLTIQPFFESNDVNIVDHNGIKWNATVDLLGNNKSDLTLSWHLAGLKDLDYAELTPTFSNTDFFRILSLYRESEDDYRSFYFVNEFTAVVRGQFISSATQKFTFLFFYSL